MVPVVWNGDEAVIGNHRVTVTGTMVRLWRWYQHPEFRPEGKWIQSQIGGDLRNRGFDEIECETRESAVACAERILRWRTGIKPWRGR